MIGLNSEVVSTGDEEADEKEEDDDDVECRLRDEISVIPIGEDFSMEDTPADDLRCLDRSEGLRTLEGGSQ